MGSTTRRVAIFLGILSIFLAALPGCLENDLPTVAETGIKIPPTDVPEYVSGTTYPKLESLRIEGNKVVNETGAPVQLRGMMTMDPFYLDSLGVWNKSLWKIMVEDWHSNLIRLDVHPHSVREVGGIRNYLHYLNDSVRWAGEFGAYLIIDWHIIGNVITEKSPMETSRANFTESVEFWNIVSYHFRNCSSIIFELCNEPGDISWDSWRRIAEDWIDNILIPNGAKDQIIIVGGANYGNMIKDAYKNPVNTSAPYVAYASHIYPSHYNTDSWQEYYWGKTPEKYSIWATELGFDSDSEMQPFLHGNAKDYGDPYVDLLESNKMPWIGCWFSSTWEPRMFYGDNLSSYNDPENWRDFGEFMHLRLASEDN